jgi:L-cystine transport system permease protein
MFDSEVLLPDFWEILGAVPVTVAMALAIFVLSTIVGSLFAMIEYRQIPVLKELVVAYKVVFKGVPMVIVIFLAYYGLPPTLQFLTSLVGVDYNGHSTPNMVTLIVALTLCVSAFQAEVVK